MFEKKPVARTRESHIALNHGSGEFEYRAHAQEQPDRILLIDGVRYEVVAQDQDGVWMYRRVTF